MSEKSFQNLKIKPIEKSQVEIEGEVSADTFGNFYKSALAHTVKTAEVPGFRAGTAPENIVINHIGETKILEKAAQIALDEIYGAIVTEQNIRAIGAPQIVITKLAKDNPLGFKIQTAVLPEVNLENYKKLSTEEIKKIPEQVSVEEKDVDAVIDDIRKQVARDSGTPDTLPEVNTDFIKKFGDFADLEAFRKQIRDNLTEHKKRETKDRQRAAIAEKLIAEAKFDLPDVIIESELDTMVGQLKADIERSGMTFEGYLSQIKKKEEEIRKEWHDSAVKRARLELILKHIARKENIKPEEEVIKKEVDHIMSHHKTADRFRVRMYIENLLTNQKVFDFLES